MISNGKKILALLWALSAGVFLPDFNPVENIVAGNFLPVVIGLFTMGIVIVVFLGILYEKGGTK